MRMTPQLLAAMALRIPEPEAVGSRKSLAEAVVDVHMELGEAARVMVAAESGNELAGEVMVMGEVVSCSELGVEAIAMAAAAVNYSKLVEVAKVMVEVVNCI